VAHIPAQAGKHINLKFIRLTTIKKITRALVRIRSNSSHRFDRQLLDLAGLLEAWELNHGSMGHFPRGHF
jgi:hypothetical protein